MGPGSHLAHIFHWFMVNATPECPCRQTAAKMDEWGPDGCEEHMEYILDTIEKEAHRRRLPFHRWTVERIVRLAIYKARKDLRRK